VTRCLPQRALIARQSEGKPFFVLYYSGQQPGSSNHSVIGAAKFKLHQKLPRIPEDRIDPVGDDSIFSRRHVPPLQHIICAGLSTKKTGIANMALTATLRDVSFSGMLWYPNIPSVHLRRYGCVGMHMCLACGQDRRQLKRSDVALGLIHPSEFLD
jgi:hypothetical protein